MQAPEFTATVLPSLVNALTALGGPVVLVLDDYHVITERACHQQLNFLLAHLPSSVQLVLTTRVNPPLRLGRLRAAGQLLDIRPSQLRLAPAHVAALVHAVSGVELIGSDLADLVARTEGWPAGVYLAALSLRGHPSPHEFIGQFSGDNRFIGDFLAEEVLSRQPPEVRQFLVRTSVLGRFCAPLGAAVSGVANPAEILDLLERDNLFIVPLDETRQWFRYHHLFRQVLRSHLARAEPDLVPALHEAASAWHQLHGSADEAICHAMACGDFRLAIDLIADYWFGYVSSGQVARCTTGSARWATAGSRPARWPRTARRGRRPCPGTGSPPGAGSRSSRPRRTRGRCRTGCARCARPPRCCAAPTGSMACWSCANQRPPRSGWKPTRRHRGTRWPAGHSGTACTWRASPRRPPGRSRRRPGTRRRCH